jgi:hypothetical protein
MSRKDILQETVRQFLADFPGIDVQEHLSYEKGFLDDVRFLLDIESRRLRGALDLSDEEREEIDRLGCFGRDDLGPTRFTGYAMHDLDASKKKLHELLTVVSIEAKKLRKEVLHGYG